MPATRTPNRLVNEASPYLLQHAHNPVDWYPWGSEALQRAQAENKPILVSIGYAACHWCHVMERESFENEQIATYMNTHFINIKIDREERPDLDHIYMDALTALTGQGGWPLNCFLMPDGRPFYGGTYFPPTASYGRPDWLSVLTAIADAFEKKREELEQQADQLTYHILKKQDNAVFQAISLPEKNIQTDNSCFDPQQAHLIYRQLTQAFDHEDGGFGNAPKFPATMTINFLLKYHYHTHNSEALQHALFSLNQLCNGGIYDHIGGGFARYTTDKQWLIPHFEKMLYDNALIVSVLADAYKITQNPQYADTIDQTLDFIARQMTHPDGGFYASLDADSEGHEGKFYVWEKNEIDKLLQDDAPIFNAFYGITPSGNWEGKNILNRTYTIDVFAERIGYDTGELNRHLAIARRKLFLHREKRVKPALDNKIILGWNALQCTAYCKAFEALRKEPHRQAAIKNMAFLLDNLKQYAPKQAPLCHTHKKTNPQPAFLDDYAFVIEALLALYRIADFDTTYIEQAVFYTNYVLQNFDDPNSAAFFYTHREQTDLIGRKKESYDNATPSGNATMAQNLFQLAILTGNQTYKTKATQMLKSIQPTIMKYPSAFSRWTALLLDYAFPVYEIAVVGQNAHPLADQIRDKYLGGSLLMAATADQQQYPLLQQRYRPQQTLIYLCKDYVCTQPMTNLDDFEANL